MKQKGALHLKLSRPLKKNAEKTLLRCEITTNPQAAVVHFNLRAGSTFPVPVCTEPHELWVNKADTQQD